MIFHGFIMGDEMSRKRPRLIRRGLRYEEAANCQPGHIVTFEGCNVLRLP